MYDTIRTVSSALFVSRHGSIEVAYLRENPSGISLYEYISALTQGSERTREQQLVLQLQRAQLAEQLALEVLQPVALINDEILQLQAPQELDVAHRDLIGGHDG